ncbi:MAG: GAF domain-containing protein [Chloroflexota bacterium]|nr:GAF domain-containing protein [Chloroflexota bacterium]
MRTLRNVHLWAIVLIFVGCCILHYAEQIGLLATASPSTHFGLTRHALERILFVGPVVYAAYIFGLRAGLVACAAALAAMLPRAIFISPVPADALVETSGMVVIGVLSTLGLWRLAREREKGQVYLAELESAHKVLQHYVQSARGSEKRLTILNAISAVLGESLEPERVLRKATQMVSELMDVEVALIYTLDEEAQELTLVAYEGVSDEFASVVGRVGVGEGIYGEVAKTGQAMIVEDASRDPRMSQPEVAKMRIHIQLIVPLVLKERVRGALCVAMRRPREFTQEDIELLTAVGTQIATAIENAFLYDRERVVAQRLAASERNLRRLFENASDAIWVHDLSGDIAIANQAAAELTGYPVDELVKMNVKSFLLEDGLTVAGQIRRNLLEKEPVEQPYEQRLVRKDGTEAILSVATGLVVEECRYYNP